MRRVSASAVLLFLFTFFVVALNAVWIRLDQAPPTWDPALYLRWSVTFFHQLEDGRFFDFLSEYVNSFWGVKAPLIGLVPLPFYFVFGVSHDTALCSLLVFVVAFNFFTYLLMRELSRSRTAALLTVVIASTMPMVIWLSREFFVEYAVMTFVMMWLWCLVKSKQYTIRRYNIFLGVITGLGLLTKVLFPLYIFVPALVALVQRLRESPKKLFPDFLTVLVPTFLLSVTWYGGNWWRALRFAFGAGYGATGQDFAIGPILSLQTVSAYWHAVVTKGISEYYAAITFVLIAVILAQKFFHPQKTFCHRRGLWFLASVIIFPCVVLTFGVNKDVRYVLPILPALAGAIALLAMNISQKGRRIIAAGVVIIPLSLFAFATFGVAPPWSFHSAQVAATAFHFGAAYPPERRIFPVGDVVAAFTPPTSALANRDSYVLSSVSLRYVNVYTLTYYLEITRHQQVHVVEVPNGTSDELALSGVREADYIVAQQGGVKTGDPFNRYSVLISDHLVDGSLPFRKKSFFPFPDGTMLEVWARQDAE